VGASNELSNEDHERTAYASRHRRGSSGILLRSAAGLGVFESRRLRPALAHTLNDRRAARRSARFFSSSFVVALQAANTAAGDRRARKRQRCRCGKQHRHDSKESEYIALHEPVPRLL